MKARGAVEEGVGEIEVVGLLQDHPAKAATYRIAARRHQLDIGARVRVPGALTVWPDGSNGHHAVDLLRKLGEALNRIALEEFVAATLACWEKRVPFGTYNVTNPGHITTRQVVGFIKASGVSKKEFSFFESEDEFMQVAAKTPRSNCVMDSSKLESVGIRLTPVEDAVALALRNWRQAAA